MHGRERGFCWTVREMVTNEVTPKRRRIIFGICQEDGKQEVERLGRQCVSSVLDLGSGGGWGIGLMEKNL